MTVETFEIRKRALYEGGQPFGDTGPYERLDVLVHFAVDPGNKLNAGIADLELAGRGADGLVRFEADLVLLKPVDPAKGNGGLYSSVVNRGRTALLPFSFPPPGMDLTPTERVEPGDGMLLRQGFTVALCGWQWDVLRSPSRLGLSAPVALDGEGAPVTTEVTVQFQPLTARHSEYLGHWPVHASFNDQQMHEAYAAEHLDDPDAVLTVSGHHGGPRETIPRNQWRFARRDGSGHEAPNAKWITLDGGFEIGRVYELSYRAAACPVAGVGLLSIRDIASFLRHDASAANPCAGTVRRAIVHGVSQTGRVLREFVRVGCNVDEAGRQVFDGVFSQVSGARTGEFNFRGAQPSVQYVQGPAFEPPYAYVPTSETNATLLDAQRARGGVPKIFEVNTGNEYWRSDAFLVHGDPATGADLVQPDHVRVYMLAGCQHGAGMPQLSDRPFLNQEQRTANLLNMLNQTALLRSALLNLDAWIDGRAAPPASAVPLSADRTAVPVEDVTSLLRTIPGAATPDLALFASRSPASGKALVSAVDSDGNEVAGVRLPEVAVPVATYAGWNVRHPDIGGVGQITDMVGSTIPFPRTALERSASGDPRPSIEERYGDRSHYLELVRTAAGALVADRWLLPEDLDRSVANAGRLYDRVMEAPPRTA